MGQKTRRRTGDNVYLAYSVDLVSEELNADRLIVGVCRENLDSVPAHAEHVASKSDIISLVAYFYKLFEQLIKIARLTRAQ